MSDYFRRWLKVWIELSARVRGKRFYCRSLAGQSEYNTTVNCDLTVSCNCQDYDGSGHMGDLNKQSFKEVFFGPVANRFREVLAKGKLPIMTCARCGELKCVSKRQIKTEPLDAYLSSAGGTEATANGNGDKSGSKTMVYAGPKPRLPYRGMLLENTVRCNIDCIGCDRQSAARIRTTLQMDLEKLSRMADLVHDLNLEQLYYLNLGEPFLSPNIGKELPILRAKNPDCRIVISSNAIVVNTDAKREAALSASHIFFSIAGISDEMLKKYERFGSFQKAYENMKALVAYRDARGSRNPFIEWKYLLFNWNDHSAAIQRAIELAREANVDAISFWPTNNPWYGYSYRYRLGALNNVGIESWKGREVILRPRTTEAQPSAAQAATAQKSS
jgi:organic radical activating enzyme